MADKSKIEWTDASWNPIRGCSRVSEGCVHCYAERQAARFSGPGQPYEGLATFVRHTGRGDLPTGSGHGAPSWTGKVILAEDQLELPLHWRKPRKIFVCSMSDLFHEEVEFSVVGAIWSVMERCAQHTFQLLTKRPKRMQEFMSWVVESRNPRHLNSDLYPSVEWPVRNIWLGVSVENQKAADQRIPLLLQTPAAVRWVSYEPALGPVNLQCIRKNRNDYFDSIGGIRSIRPCLDWVVCGGESGPGARPMHPDWARIVRDQCQAAGVPFFFKAWGEWLPGDGDGKSPAIWQDGSKGIHPSVRVGCDRGPRYEKFGPLGEPGAFALRVGKKAAGRLLDGREWNEYPEARD